MSAAERAAAIALLVALKEITGHFAGVMGGPLVAGRGIEFANGVENIPTIAKAIDAIANAEIAGIKAEGS